MAPSRVPDGETRGHIVPIGGAENKENDPKILARFVKVSGGEDAGNAGHPARIAPHVAALGELDAELADERPPLGTSEPHRG